MTPRFKRTPFEDVVFDSPFEGLKEHSCLVKETTKELKKGIKLYVDGEFDEAQESFDKVSTIEHDADKVKIYIRRNLPRFILMPITRGDFLSLLKESDHIADTAEDVGFLLPMREEEIPNIIKKDFKMFSEKVFESVKQFEVLMEGFTEVLDSTFSKKPKERIKRLQQELSRKEHEADKIQKKISKKLFNYDENPMTALHLLKVTNKMDRIADYAENVGDRVDTTIGE